MKVVPNDTFKFGTKRVKWHPRDGHQLIKFNFMVTWFCHKCRPGISQAE